MTTGYTVTATCPTCGGELLPSETPEILAPDHTTTEARCDDCLTLWRLDLTATCVETWPVPRDRDDVLARVASRSAEGLYPLEGALR